MRFNNHSNTSCDQTRARNLRNNAAPVERKLWRLLGPTAASRNLKFRRQQPLHPYIADFACMAVRLIVELDGASHDTRQAYDAERDYRLRQMGYTILRFTNDDVMQNAEAVVAIILQQTEKLMNKTSDSARPHAPLPDPPRRGEGDLLRTLIHHTAAQLAAAGVDNPMLDARLLIAHALHYDRLQLVMQAEKILSAEEVQTIHQLITRRAAREPVARILGLREFWGLPFALNEATLEPRPDSETLIEAALSWVRGARIEDREKEKNLSDPRSPTPQSLLDLGTGTGCLLLALLHEWPDATGLGIDLAPRAVEQAQANAARLGLDDRAVFRTGDWLDGVTGRFDLVISNPPYIAAAEIPQLMPEVRDHDPIAALDGGVDGLDPYRAIIPALPPLLTPQGIAIFEVGSGQAPDVLALCHAAGLTDTSLRRDLGGIERCVVARRPR